MISFKKWMDKNNEKMWAGKPRADLVKIVLRNFEMTKYAKSGWEVSHIKNPKFGGKYAGNIDVTIIKGGKEKVIKL